MPHYARGLCVIALHFVVLVQAEVPPDGDNLPGCATTTCSVGYDCIEGVGCVETCSSGIVQCPEGLHCYNLGEIGADGQAFECVPNCPEECLEGEVCGPDGHCVPTCDSMICSAGETCDPATGACVPEEVGCEALMCPFGWECHDGRCVDSCEFIDIACPEGSTCRDGGCTDINECLYQTFMAQCEPGFICVNTAPGYECAPDLCQGDDAPRCEPPQLCESLSGRCVDSDPHMGCPDDVFFCADGHEVTRDPTNECEFFPCAVNGLFCTEEARICPDGRTSVTRDPANNCEFTPCPDEELPVCTADVDQCPDGSFVRRDPKNDCNFFPCPDPLPVCTADAKECPDGTFVGRDPLNGCEFFPCPPPDLCARVLCQPGYACHQGECLPVPDSLPGDEHVVSDKEDDKDSSGEDLVAGGEERALQADGQKQAEISDLVMAPSPADDDGDGPSSTVIILATVLPVCGVALMVGAYYQLKRGKGGSTWSGSAGHADICLELPSAPPPTVTVTVPTNARNDPADAV